MDDDGGDTMSGSSRAARRQATRDSLSKMADEGFNSQKSELDRLQQQLEDMENKIGGGGGEMARMMDQLSQLQ